MKFNRHLGEAKSPVVLDCGHFVIKCYYFVRPLRYVFKAHLLLLIRFMRLLTGGYILGLEFAIHLNFSHTGKTVICSSYQIDPPLS